MGKSLDYDHVFEVSTFMLRRLVDMIHARSPDVIIVVLGKWSTYPVYKEVNKKVREAVEKWPRTYYAEPVQVPNFKYFFQHEGMYGGHLDCRGCKLTAHQIIRRLWDAKVLSRSIVFTRSFHEDMYERDCSKLQGAACHTAGFCWLNPVSNGTCKPFGPGFGREFWD